MHLPVPSGVTVGGTDHEAGHRHAGVAAAGAAVVGAFRLGVTSLLRDEVASGPGASPAVVGLLQRANPAGSLEGVAHLGLIQLAFAQ